MPTTRVNDVTLNYTVQGEGEAIVFIHGLGSSLRDWEVQADHFAATHRVITFDLRGHGLSEITDGYTVKQFAADTAALIEALDAGPAHVVGISLGGGIAFQLAADRPDLVNRLVVVNSVQGFDADAPDVKKQVKMRRILMRILSMKKMGSILAERLFPDPGMEKERALMIERWAENDKKSYRRAFEAVVSWPGVVDEMAAYDKPITIISAEHDYVPPSEKEPWIAKMPTATMVVIPDSHHAVPMERPDAFNEAVADALRS